MSSVGDVSASIYSLGALGIQAGTTIAVGKMVTDSAKSAFRERRSAPKPKPKTKSHKPMKSKSSTKKHSQPNIFRIRWR